MRILVITAHPDDLEMNMGGTVKKLADKGDIIDNVVLCGDDSRKKYLEQTTKILKYNSIFYSVGKDRPIMNHHLVNNFEDWLQHNDKTAMLKEYGMIVTHWKEDWHQDHRTCYNLTRALQRNIVCDIMYMDAFPYNHKYANFEANVYVDISQEMFDKEQAILKFENLDSTWSGRIKSYNFYRGSFMKTSYAECFKLETMIM
jgi:LmbE family N-acetylglucosaminyl deacetylase